VGDDAQSIYSFRGAKIENILSFKKDYPSAMVFKLEQNYRSTQTIVDAANSVIVRNSKRMEKHCFSEGDVGDKIRILKAYTDREEAEMVVTDLRDKVRAAGDEWSEAVILYRTNNQSAVLEDNLRRRGIPYRIYKGSSFYDHKEIRDMMAYIRLVINPRDDEAFKRIVNYPARGIGDTTVQRIAALAAERGVSMWEAVDALVAEPVTDPVQRTIARKVADFVAMIRALSLARNDKGLYDFGLEIASRSGIIAAYRTENTPEAASALDNIEELLNSMQEFKERVDAEIRGGERPEEEEATIEEWLQNMMLMTDMDQDDPDSKNKVTLMTVHSAKGLEYKYVYIVGLEENLFPSQRVAGGACPPVSPPPVTASPTACTALEVMSRNFEISSRSCEKSVLPISAPIGGIRMAFTSDDTILPKAPPMITPTAMSITFPLRANSLNSLKNAINLRLN